MGKIGLIYSYNTQKTANVAKEFKELYGASAIEEMNAEDVNGKIFTSFDNLVLGVPTWFDGELPNYWDEFVPELETLNLKGKKIALFGNGDQIGYPENFVDAIGVLAEILEARGAKIVGHTSIEGYSYESSRAVKNGKFQGLAIDFENQSELNTKRIKAWVTELKKEFV
jgi:flavodoxin I